MKQGNIGVTTENIFPVIKKFLYSDHEIFIREIVSNAVDATQKLKTLSMKGDFKGELGNLAVRVSVDPEAKTLTISDRGIGMTAEEIAAMEQVGCLQVTLGPRILRTETAGLATISALMCLYDEMNESTE